MRVVTTPRRVPQRYHYPPLTNHIEWWCLRDRNITYADAGHLLWFDWNATDVPGRLRKLMRVERLRVWELEPGDLFECNGTQWAWGTDFSCLQILPSGYPALIHCHGPDMILLICGIIIFYIFIYANLVAFHKAYRYMKQSTQQYVDRKLRRNRGKVPMIRKNKHLPYLNAKNKNILDVPKLLQKGESSDFPPSYFEWDRFVA